MSETEEKPTRPIKLLRTGDAILSIGASSHPYLKLPPAYEQTTLLGVKITDQTIPKVYGITAGQQYTGKEGWVSVVYAFKLDDVGIEQTGNQENDETPFEEEEE
jgi:hypothetical protein